jgi:hypothetical protein
MSEMYFGKGDLEADELRIFSMADNKPSRC